MVSRCVLYGLRSEWYFKTRTVFTYYIKFGFHNSMEMEFQIVFSLTVGIAMFVCCALINALIVLC